jgi:hypothetical protein
MRDKKHEKDLEEEGVIDSLFGKPVNTVSIELTKTELMALELGLLQLNFSAVAMKCMKDAARRKNCLETFELAMFIESEDKREELRNRLIELREKF